MSDFHGRIMNIQERNLVPEGGVLNVTFEETCGGSLVIAYKVGHRDARHAAAEIAVEADRQLAAAEQMAEYLSLMIQSGVIDGIIATKANKMLAAWEAAKK